MLDEHLLGILLELGLNEKEAKVYLASLSLGPTAVLQISGVCGIKRSSIYPIMERLKRLGLMVEQIRGLKTFYQAEPPEKLELVLEERKAKFKNSLPDFSKLYNLQGQHNIIKRYDGIQAIKSVYEDLLLKIKPHQDYLIISDQSKWVALDEKYFSDFARRRAKLPINIRMLQIDTPVARWYKKYEANFNFKIKFLPKNTELVTNLVIIPEMLVIHQLTPPVMAMVIDNKSAIQLHQQLFEIIWNTLL
jgi:sugar-specific transcriptional regulator TrmB